MLTEIADTVTHDTKIHAPQDRREENVGKIYMFNYTLHNSYAPIFLTESEVLITVGEQTHSYGYVPIHRVLTCCQLCTLKNKISLHFPHEIMISETY